MPDAHAEDLLEVQDDSMRRRYLAGALVDGWDADGYQRRFGYVSALAGDLLELLDPVPTETVLDLGCGTGELAAEIQRRGAEVMALDADPAMVAAARRRLGGDRVLLADGHDFTLPEPVDAVFSNAALHWMPRPAEVARRVRAALAPGGRFVAELGGAGNIDAILEALAAAMDEAGLPGPTCPWYFPTPGRYATLLEGAGFRVARMEHFSRPTPLEGGPGGLADWLAMFGGSLTAAVPAALRERVVARTAELARPRLWRGGRFVADYWRLRFVAVAGAEPARPAKLHRQTAGDRGG
jgi:trans-aconitate methyltransferase